MIRLLEQLEVNGSRNNTCQTQPLGIVGQRYSLEYPLWYT